MKPTDIWHNNPNWIAKPMCKNGDSCHEPAPRGSKTGTQGKLNAAERSLVPAQLAFEILEAVKPTTFYKNQSIKHAKITMQKYGMEGI